MGHTHILKAGPQSFDDKNQCIEINSIDEYRSKNHWPSSAKNI